MDLQVQGEQKAAGVPEVLMDQWGSPDHEVLRAFRESQANWGPMASRGRWERLGRQDHEASQVSKDLPDPKEPKGLQATRDPRDPRGQQDR